MPRRDRWEVGAVAGAGIVEVTRAESTRTLLTLRLPPLAHLRADVRQGRVVRTEARAITKPVSYTYPA
jgi:hypothetical protein